MKTFLALLLSCVGLTAQPIQVPITLSAEIPVIYTNITYITTNVSYITYVTNLTVVNITTNITQIITNPVNTAFTTLTSDVVDAKLGERLVRFMSGPANFTLLNFTPNKAATLYYVNPGRFPIRFPTNAWFMGIAPTNQARGAVLIEGLSQEIWITP